MGILDEAIREHLELKRQHGADESELQGLEDEAFGEAERPDAVSPSPGSEDQTQVISPGSSVTSPAGEGDQLDKVFEATRQREADAEAAVAREAAKAKGESTETPAPVDPEATFAEHPVPEPPAPAEAAGEAATVESPEAKPTEPEAAVEPPAPAQEGDAGDMLEAERHHLASHPTEHYDVDAAIAEEDEIDVLSESSLSDELDRALESGETAVAGGETVEYDMSSEPDSGEFEFDEPDSAEMESAEHEAEPESAGQEAVEGDSAELLYQDGATEDQPVDQDEPETGEEDAEGSSEFYDQNDVLEGTPDFLEETPEHDQLWFEQKEPKDFDFGD
ncbi:MAG TPA: hypothetical protein PKA56_06330 [Solirubrobacterales bacterium]|nr:hypothetical protein [Solirubrobacterales bacterium]HMU28174.1 hypothetical protein [Solirubrobacterales bacterium]HMX71354.1 hypothetical protein [Solirubrobacterales bacterium]HMY26955.1 hypothetical protein [Solirubrobacterales bacterium]HNA24970.1 hypothetical protein [Solirubrobacterales bacterium]